MCLTDLLFCQLCNGSSNEQYEDVNILNYCCYFLRRKPESLVPLGGDSEEQALTAVSQIGLSVKKTGAHFSHTQPLCLEQNILKKHRLI